MFEIKRETYDTVIVGARCAGAFTALHLARGGQRVLVIDRDRHGADTLSTHALMRLGVSLLDEADVLPQIIAAGTPAVRKTGFTYAGHRTEVEITPKGRAEGLYAPRRFLLDRILVDAARDAGATFIFQASFEGLIRNGEDRPVGLRIRMPDGAMRDIRCNTVVGADGRRSAVATAAGAGLTHRGQNRSASIYTYVAAPDRDSYEWLYGPGTMAGLIPTNGGQACAFASVTPGELAKLANENPYDMLRRKFEACGAAPSLLPEEPTDRVRRFAGAQGHIKQAFGPGWALVGDAGYFKDPATAHGITDALRDARSLAQALLAGGEAALRDYQDERDALSLPLFELTDRIAGFDWSMEEVRRLHTDLHQVMRAEQIAVLGQAQKSAA